VVTLRFVLWGNTAYCVKLSLSVEVS